jgi:hypothetical protein
MDKVILTRVYVEARQEGQEETTWTVQIWESAYVTEPGVPPDILRPLRGYGTTQEEAVASLLHDRYVEGA